MRTPSTRRVADDDLRQALAQALGDRVERAARGTMARRIAVHFWPALTVISRATSLTNRSNSSSSGVTSGAEDRRS